jgi:hypothetical protein
VVVVVDVVEVTCANAECAPRTAMINTTMSSARIGIMDLLNRKFVAFIDTLSKEAVDSFTSPRLWLNVI